MGGSYAFGWLNFRSTLLWFLLLDIFYVLISRDRFHIWLFSNLGWLFWFWYLSRFLLGFYLFLLILRGIFLLGLTLLFLGSCFLSYFCNCRFGCNWFLLLIFGCLFGLILLLFVFWLIIGCLFLNNLNWLCFGLCLRCLFLSFSGYFSSLALYLFLILCLLSWLSVGGIFVVGITIVVEIVPCIASAVRWEGSIVVFLTLSIPCHFVGPEILVGSSDD
jgi:hypothetical protein